MIIRSEADAGPRLMARQDSYTKRWVIYSAPFTPHFDNGVMMAFSTQSAAENYVSKKGELK